ncbi:Mitogen-activated protein kinase 16 [Vitis vinifera]|uniref:mitogen-activated protein kinase n=1 Tax=Vitis vinifera TaxID=29760 RepID=A0A438KKY8_VITVI|nr:Mitogen-activated protein kinase 16 [Vitis vinifera]
MSCFKRSFLATQASVEVDFFTEYGEGSRYRIEEVIGKGSYGVVCSAYDTHCGEKVAIKKINDIFEHVSDATRILREIKLLRLLRHPDIVEIKHILLPPSSREFKDIYVVFELMESDLHQVIKANDDLTPEHYQFFLYQLLRGLKYIHTANVFHRDLKPKNILANADCKLKICDFGLARVAFNDTPTAIFWTDYVATRWYRAPELCGSFFSKVKGLSPLSIDCANSLNFPLKEVRGKLRGIILERSRGFSSWIWFGDGSLKRLLEGIEECCREEKEGRVVKVWEDEGRKFKLERRVNGAGRFILCSVLNIEAKRFCLVFPEAKGLLGGWATLAEKLRSLGVCIVVETKNAPMPIVGKLDKRVEEDYWKGLLGGWATLAEKLRSLGVCIVAEMKNAPMPIVGKLDKRVGSVEKCEEKAFVEVARAPVGRIGDALWLQLDGKEKRSREEQLGHCLLGRYLQYTPAIDIWSIGCIFAELLTGKPLFPGKNVVHQLDLMTDLLGTPSAEAIARVRNEKARRYLSSMRKKKPIPLSQKFPNADPLALRLLERMLAFEPKDRPSAEEALADPYFKGLAKAEREPSAQPVTKLEFEFERRRITKEDVRDLIYREILEYHPKMLKEYLEGTEPTSFMYPRKSSGPVLKVWLYVHPAITLFLLQSLDLMHEAVYYAFSAVDQFKKQFAYLEEHYGNGATVAPPERQHASLPRPCVLYSDNSLHNSAEVADDLSKCCIKEVEKPHMDRSCGIPWQGFLSKFLKVPKVGLSYLFASVLNQFWLQDKIGGAARPGKVVGSVLRYNNCGAAAAAEVLEQRRMVRNPPVASQYNASSCSYPRRNSSCKNERGDDEGVEGSNGLQPKPQYMARKVAAAQGGSGSHWY